MKVAIITANIGGIDQVKGIPRQTVESDFYYYTESNLPFPLPNLENRLKSKYLKIQTHRFLPNYDAYIWLDGSVKVNGTNFVENFLDQLNGHHVAIYKHKDRCSPYNEIEYVVEEMMKGNHYLLSRYAKQQLIKELLFFQEKELPRDYLLFNCYTFARMNDKITNAAFDEWWMRCIEFSNFDQAMFSYVSWLHKLDINILSIDPLRTHKLFTRESHI